MNNCIYHIATRSAWSAALNRGSYSTSDLVGEGFIHCSKVDQILRVANKFYSGQYDLVILGIDLSLLKPELRWEPGTDKADELFPHIYGELNLDAVVKVFEFAPGLDGIFILPEQLI